MMEDVGWPEAPNAYAAVTSTLPTLSGILAAFSSGYFAAIIVSDSAALSSCFTLAPFMNPAWLALEIPVSKKAAIGFTSVATLITLFYSIVQSVAALMLQYDPSNYEGKTNPPPVVQTDWRTRRQSATSNALRLFHIGLPLMALSLALLLDGPILTTFLYVICYWLVRMLFAMVVEKLRFERAH
jgi:hypothetical protein